MPSKVAEDSPVTGVTGFEAFYRRERPGLYRSLALTLGDADLAAEAVDEAMTRACQRWGRVRRYDNPAGWVYRVGLNWAISRIRKRTREVQVPALHAVAETPVDGGYAMPDEQLQEALAALPDKQRAAVVLRYHLDWSIEQIATAVDAPAGTVKSRLHRAVAAMRDELEGRR